MFIPMWIFVFMNTEINFKSCFTVFNKTIANRGRNRDVWYHHQFDVWSFMFFLLVYRGFNHFASVDVYTCQTLPDRLTVDISHEIWCSYVWTGWHLFPPRVARHTAGWLSRSPWDVTLGYPTAMNEFTLFMDVMPNPFIQDMFLWLTGLEFL